VFALSSVPERMTSQQKLPANKREWQPQSKTNIQVVNKEQHFHLFLFSVIDVDLRSTKF